MAQRERPQPNEIARDLRFIVRIGTRAATLCACLDEAPALASTCAPLNPGSTDYDLAITICRAVAHAVESLGDGPYGRAAKALFGLSPVTRGLTLPRRRGQAAQELDIQPSTIVRHWQTRIEDDLAIAIYQQAQA